MNLAPLVNAFPKKTRVTFIHAITGQVIGTHKMSADQLPISFTKPLTIEWQGIEWRVLRADPVHAKEFISGTKLTLHVQENTLVDSGKTGFNIATICNDMPPVAGQPLYDGFSSEISKEQWRQLQFFPSSLLPLVQEEILKVELILFPDDGTNTLEGYKTMHIRKKILQESLDIAIPDFCSQVGILEKGGVRLASNGFVENGVTLRSLNYIYYGTTINERIEELCLQTFESADQEFYELSSSYNLILADWCNGKIIMV